MLTLLEIARLLRRAKVTQGPAEVSPELRGWAYDRQPVKPPAYLGLALSDFAYGYCPTGRSLYLKYVLGERPQPTKPLAEGQALHAVLFKALEDFRRYVYSGTPMSPPGEGMPEDLRAKAEALYRYIAVRLTGEYQHVLASRLARSRDAAAFYAAPIAAQIAVDGAPLGLSYVVADGVALGAVVEFKFGPSQNVDVALAGYAMAIEAEYGVPIDYGIHVQISIDGQVEYRATAYHLGDAPRAKFLEARDEAIDVVASARDPGPAPQCPKTCPYYSVCRS
ncbi:type I-A CRISPR-associated protein Cas4/Csa1 [Pyrobaculum neutrophilum]|uniref:CRISPR-associated protein, Csa1 family n=1 Tax=Pyrobaculum neutrophilum (strain DSM 2338 / JCM 9278 / NBRC 100436 / V24Sta) TaxID=444157 RepID=B1YE56_PYRNV|nr:type I-A CRISPR-associated protein Cas4/Csa1 [Pyrobaculum neutrophilum]ACB40069.1 CRISPR-associated protein, Csa1 family [Pyrobaculum neutrophilum V24Sta]